MVFIFGSPVGHDALSETRRWALISAGRISPGSFSLDKKFQFLQLVLEIFTLGFWAWIVSGRIFGYDSLFSASRLSFLSISFALTSSHSSPCARCLLCSRSFTCLDKFQQLFLTNCVHLLRRICQPKCVFLHRAASWRSCRSPWNHTMGVSLHLKLLLPQRPATS